MKNKNLIYFIPAGSGSSQLKDKNLKKIDKQTLAKITINHSIKSNIFKKYEKVYPKKDWDFFITNKYESIDINDIDDFNVCKILY